MLKILRKYTGYKLLMLCQNRGKILFLKIKEMQKNLVIFDHHIVRKSQVCSLNKLISKELHLILVDANTVKPTD